MSTTLLPFQRLVRLRKCCKSTCRHIYADDEAASIPHPDFPGATADVCPACGCKTYYMHNHGEKKGPRTSSEWKTIAWPLEPPAPVKTPPLRNFSDLPLGTRFRYPGDTHIWTITRQWREKQGGAMHGTVAQWEPDMLTYGLWSGQNICSHQPQSEGGDCPDEVEPIN